MKDEIKEILDFKENADYKRLSYEEILLIKDYITNLQEENERQSKAQVILDNQITEMSDYKSKNEKAISIIKDIFKDENWYENYEYNDLENTLKEVYQTLQGSDNND